MRRRLTQRPGGFTLIELMIVIVILGLLAALVIALVARSSRDAQRVATESAANEAQQAIAMYRQYAGELPDLINSWDPLTQQTVLPDGRTIGPFLSHPPKNMLVTSNPSCITDGAGPVLYTDVCSFLYDYNGGAGSGRFIAAYEPTP